MGGFAEIFQDNGLFTEGARLLLDAVAAAAIATARPYGFIIAFPLFSWLGVRGLLQAAIAISLGLPLALALIGGPAIGAETPFAAATADMESWLITTLVAKELFIGLALGLLMGAPFWAAEVAGAYVDYYRGAIMAVVALPRAEGQLLTTGALLQITLLALSVAAGGFTLALGAVYESYQIWPALEPLPAALAPLSPFVITLLTKIFLLSLILAAPLLIAMALAEAILALSSRMNPKLNVFDATLSAKSLVFLLILPAYLTAFAAYYVDVIPTPAEIAEQLFETARGGDGATDF